MPSAANKNLANVFAAGVLSAATLLPLSGPAMAADSLVIGTPLETKLANFGAASYPVFNSITDVSPLADKFVDFLDKKVKAPDAAEVAQKAVKGGDICLPGSAAASEKLWVAQAELTLSMPKAEASALVSSIKKAGLQASRPSLLTLVPAAEGVFSKSPEALKMVVAGKDVE